MTRTVRYKFRLYIANGAASSAEAIVNINEICRIHLADRHVVEIIDVRREPRRALEDRVIMTPTLIKLLPMPMRRIVGSLSQREHVLHALGLWNHGDAHARESIRAPLRSVDDE